MKTITFAVPCYNSAEYMDACIESLLAVGDDVEVIIVNDGSSDGTAAKADSWQERYPDIVCAVHQENGGHGAAVNAGLEHAHGRYFKVVDSDDWLDAEAMPEVMGYLREQMEYADPTDLVIANYVYEKVHENARTVMRYKNVFPVAQEFTWDDVRWSCRAIASTWTTSSSTSRCPACRRCTTSTWTCTATSSAARTSR